MLPDKVLKKQYTKITSTDAVKAKVKEELTDKVADQQIDPIYEVLIKAFNAWEGGKLSLFKDKLRAHIKAGSPFKFADTVLDKLIETVINQTLNIKVEPITQSDERYKTFLLAIPKATKTILERTLSEDEEMFGVFLEEKDKKGKFQQYLALLIINVNDMMWIPATPDKATLENGTELKGADFQRMFQPILDEAYPKKADRGVVKIIGPKEGEVYVGEIFSTKKRETLKDDEKRLELENGYTMELFVARTK
jgi:hypothetical protein